MTAATAELRRVLEAARAAGFLGPGPVEPHLRHAEGFARAVEGALGEEPTRFADLGSGGGVPGLALARRWAESGGVFVESNQRRCAWLRSALEQLGVADRIEVLEGRAELAAQSPVYRETFDAVTARSFAEPPVTAEIGAGFARVGGVMVVSEPPDAPMERWAAEPLQDLGFDAAEPVTASGAHFVVLRKAATAPDRYPRGGTAGEAPAVVIADRP